MNLTRQSLDTLVENESSAISETYFTQSTYLNSFDCSETILVGFVTPEGIETNLLFLDFGDHLYCCNRTSHISRAQINNLCEELFLVSQARFVKFEDVAIQPGGNLDYPHLTARYQENWSRTLVKDEAYLSNKQASNLRRKTRKLKEIADNAVPEFVFRKCTADDIDSVIALNAQTLTNKGRKHSFAQKQQELFKKICTDVGFIAGLYIGDKLIAGDIITILGKKAYFNVVGYDQEFEKYSPGTQVHLQALPECEARGCTQANFLWGNSRWKSDLGGERVPLSTVFVARHKRVLLTARIWLAFIPHLKLQAKVLIKSALTKLNIKRLFCAIHRPLLVAGSFNFSNRNT